MLLTENAMKLVIRSAPESLHGYPWSPGCRSAAASRSSSSSDLAFAVLLSAAAVPSDFTALAALVGPSKKLKKMRRRALVACVASHRAKEKTRPRLYGGEGLTAKVWRKIFEFV